MRSFCSPSCRTHKSFARSKSGTGKYGFYPPEFVCGGALKAPGKYPLFLRIFPERGIFIASGSGFPY